MLHSANTHSMNTRFHHQRRNKRNNNGRRPVGAANRQALKASAQRLHEKYLKDAQAAVEPYWREYYMQHADHYFRVLRSLQEEEMPEEDVAEGIPEGEDEEKSLPADFIARKTEVSAEELADVAHVAKEQDEREKDDES